MRIRYKLSVIVAIAIMLNVFISTLIQTIRSTALSRDLSVSILNHTSAYWAEHWSGRMISHFQVLRTMADIMGDYEALPQEIRRDVYDEMMMATVKANEHFFGMNVLWLPDILDSDADNLGRVGATSAGQHGSAFLRQLAGGGIVHQTLLNYNDMNAHLRGPNSRNDRVENPSSRTVEDRGEVYVVVLSSPIINRRSSQVVGILSILLDLAVAQPQLMSFMEYQQDIATMSIYSNSGHIIASSMPSYLNDNVERRTGLFGDSLPEIRRVLAAGENYQTRFFSPDMGGNLEFAIKSFPLGNNSGATWSVSLTIAEESIMAPINAITREAIIIVSLLSLAIITACVLFFGKATQPLLWLQHEIGILAQGDFRNVDLYHYNGNDEISALISSFDRTQKGVHALISQVQKEAESLSGIGETLSANMSQTAAAVNEIAANIQSVKSRAVNQSASVTETSSTMKQLVKNIDKLDGFIGDQSSNVSAASSAVEEMAANIRSVTDTLVKNSANVKHLMEASEVGRTGINEVAADIQEIARESAGLMEINAVMENIASQTNLLSMNAAIEAAHAGDAGKGFAVVADEIRKLAESSKEQSKIINAVLKKIKTSIDKIAISNENVLDKFEDIEAGIRVVSEQEDNIRNAMEEQEVGSRQIVNGILEITEITRKVKNGSSEMLQGANEVIRETGSLEIATREIGDSMNEMVSGADQINSAVSQVNSLSRQNSHAINTLVKEVSHFQV
ncbi:MAG: methyl-accepting chemotaxis protein [Spirochaetes bacterium]|nr:methyl-accepting chemotaxis protein [Spirochaetota bacterium]